MSATLTWTSADVSINTGEDDALSLKGWIPNVQPNLAVNVSDSGTVWGVTHVPSGWGVARWFQTRGAAEALIVAIAELADWSVDAAVLRQKEDLAGRIWPIRAEIYAREERGDFGPVDRDLVAEWNRFETRLEEVQPTRELGMKIRARRQRFQGGAR